MSYACQKLENVIRWRSYLSDPKKVWSRESDKKRIATELAKLEKQLKQLKLQAARYKGDKYDKSKYINL